MEGDGGILARIEIRDPETADENKDARRDMGATSQCSGRGRKPATPELIGGMRIVGMPL